MSTANLAHYRLPADTIVGKEADQYARRWFLLLSLLMFWPVTQFIAWRFAYAHALGQPLWKGLYAPWACLLWAVRLLPAHFHNVALELTIRTTFEQGAVLLAVGIFVAWYASQQLRARKLRTLPGAYDLKGSARFAGSSDIVKIEKALRGKLPVTRDRDPNPGVYLGLWRNPERPSLWMQILAHFSPAIAERTRAEIWLRDSSDRHVALIGPTRSGKSNVLFCTAFTWTGSIVFNDPKGEFYELTAWYRKNVLKQIVLRVDLTCTDGTSARFNPLNEIRIGTEYEIADAQEIATMLVDPHGQGLETGGESDHWRKASREVLTATMLHILYDTDVQEKSLNSVDAFLSSPNRSVVQTFERMKYYQHDPEMKRAWLDETGQLTPTMPLIAKAATDMQHRPDRERDSVLSSAKNYLGLYRDNIVAMNTNVSDFSLEDLMNADRPVSLYLINYPKGMERLKPFMRLIINMIVRYYTGKSEFNDDGSQRQSTKHQLLMLMDEFSSVLGKLTVFLNALSFTASYRIRSLICVQDISQLESVYGDKDTQVLLANIHTLIFYATNNQRTAEYISKILGNMTVRSVGRQFRNGKLEDHGESYEGRPLMTPEEIQTMNDEAAIIQVAGQRPIAANKLRYFRYPEFTRLVHKPPERCDRIPPEKQGRHAMLTRALAESDPLIAMRRQAAKDVAAGTDVREPSIQEAMKALRPPSQDDGIEEGEIVDDV
jgi:type IV secretion system protein VirD4